MLGREFSRDSRAAQASKAVCASLAESPSDTSGIGELEEREREGGSELVLALGEKRGDDVIAIATALATST